MRGLENGLSVALSARPDQAVAEAAHVGDVGRIVRVVAELPPKTLDDGPHESRVAEAAPAPDLAQQGVVGSDPPHAERKHAQHLVFCRRKLHRPTRDYDLAAVVIDGQLAEHEAFRIGPPAEDSPDPRGELGR